jgi:hypothetical protein
MPFLWMGKKNRIILNFDNFPSYASLTIEGVVQVELAFIENKIMISTIKGVQQCETICLYCAEWRGMREASR